MRNPKTSRCGGHGREKEGMRAGGILLIGLGCSLALDPSSLSGKESHKILLFNAAVNCRAGRGGLRGNKQKPVSQTESESTKNSGLGGGSGCSSFPQACPWTLMDMLAQASAERTEFYNEESGGGGMAALAFPRSIEQSPPSPPRCVRTKKTRREGVWYLSRGASPDMARTPLLRDDPPRRKRLLQRTVEPTAGAMAWKLLPRESQHSHTCRKFGPFQTVSDPIEFEFDDDACCDLYSKGLGEGVSPCTVDETHCAAADDGHTPDPKEATVRAKWRNMRILRSRATSPENEARRWPR